MGGFNSGTWLRAHSKRTTLRYLSIDLRQLRKSGKLIEGNKGNIIQTEYNQETYALSYEVEADLISTKTHFWSYSEHKWKTYYHLLTTRETSCNYGGTRKWFLCDGCERRVIELFLYEGNYQCRQCTNLTYRSQQLSRRRRLLRKAKRLRVKLGQCGDLTRPLPKKPKGMHYYTYDRLCYQIYNNWEELSVFYLNDLKTVGNYSPPY